MPSLLPLLFLAMVVGLEAIGGVLGLGSVVWASDLLILHKAAFLSREPICCRDRSSSMEGDLVQSRGELCTSSWNSTILKLSAVNLAKLPRTSGNSRESRCAEMNFQAGVNILRRMHAKVQCVPVGTSMLSSMLASSSILYNGWAAQRHVADVHNYGLEHPDAGEFDPAHEGGMQYLCCTLLSFFCSDYYCKLCALVRMPICWRSLDDVESYIRMRAGRDVGLLIRSQFVLTLVLLPI